MRRSLLRRWVAAAAAAGLIAGPAAPAARVCAQTYSSTGAGAPVAIPGAAAGAALTVSGAPSAAQAGAFAGPGTLGLPQPLLLAPAPAGPLLLPPAQAAAADAPQSGIGVALAAAVAPQAATLALEEPRGVLRPASGLGVSPLSAGERSGSAEAAAVPGSAEAAAVPGSERLPPADARAKPDLPASLRGAALWSLGAEGLERLFDGGRRALGLEPLPASGRPARGLHARLQERGADGRSPRRLAAIAAVPVAAGVSAGALALSPAQVLEPLAQAAYFVANFLSFTFLLPQLYKLIKNRSGDVCVDTLAIGAVSAGLCALNFAHDDQPLMVYRNLAQTLAFSASIAIAYAYRRSSRPVPLLPRAERGPPRTGFQAILKTGALAVALGAALSGAGAVMLAALPGEAHLGALLLPFQILAGLGYAYLMLPQLLKFDREQRLGDSSVMATWGFLGTRTIGIWAFATLLSMSAAGWQQFALLGAYPALLWTALRPFARWLAGREWRTAKSFAAFSAFLAAFVGAAYLILKPALDIPDAEARRFAMYLFYLTHNVAAFLITWHTLQSAKRCSGGGCGE